MTYEVKITQTARERISKQAAYIKKESSSSETSSRWLQALLHCTETLAEFPRRYERAEEDAHCSYEVRALHIGASQNYLLLYTIVEETRAVWVVNARGAPELPQPQSLPSSVPRVEED